jgi:hypothetical protein
MKTSVLLIPCGGVGKELIVISQGVAKSNSKPSGTLVSAPSLAIIVERIMEFSLLCSASIDHRLQIVALFQDGITFPGIIFTLLALLHCLAGVA